MCFYVRPSAQSGVSSLLGQHRPTLHLPTQDGVVNPGPLLGLCDRSQGLIAPPPAPGVIPPLSASFRAAKAVYVAGECTGVPEQPACTGNFNSHFKCTGAGVGRGRSTGRQPPSRRQPAPVLPSPHGPIPHTGGAVVLAGAHLVVRNGVEPSVGVPTAPVSHCGSGEGVPVCEDKRPHWQGKRLGCRVPVGAGVSAPAPAPASEGVDVPAPVSGTGHVPIRKPFKRPRSVAQ